MAVVGCQALRASLWSPTRLVFEVGQLFNIRGIPKVDSNTSSLPKVDSSVLTQIVIVVLRSKIDSNDGPRN